MSSAAPNRATAPGKVILLGEHSVVYGQPAIVATIARSLEVSLVEAPTGPGATRVDGDERLRTALDVAAKAFDLNSDSIAVEIRSELPVACGLGSSAALSVALVRACAERAGVATLEISRLLDLATAVENVFHGQSSGVDVAAAAHGGVLRYVRGVGGDSLSVGAGLELVVAVSAETRSTAGPVGRLRARHDQCPELYDALFATAGAITEGAIPAIAAGDWARLGIAMDAAQGLLNAFGVSTPGLEALIGVARDAGALGAKLTGAGGGGAILALAPGRTEEVAQALSAAGAHAFSTTIRSPQEVSHGSQHRAAG